MRERSLFAFKWFRSYQRLLLFNKTNEVDIHIRQARIFNVRKTNTLHLCGISSTREKFNMKSTASTIETIECEYPYTEAY